MKKEIKFFSQSTQRREDSSKRKTPVIEKRIEDLDIKKELLLDKSNKGGSTDKFQIAYRKLLVKSIGFNFDKHWYDDTMKDIKKLEATINGNESIQTIFIYLFYTIIEFNKGNIKNFCNYLDNLLVKADKLNSLSFMNYELDEQILLLVNKIIYSQVKTNLYVIMEKVPLFESFTIFTKSLLNKEHLLNLILIIGCTYLLKKNSYSKTRENYLRLLKESMSCNSHTTDKSDIFCQSLSIIVEKFDNTITLTKTNSVLKESLLNISRNTKSKDISNTSKQNNSFESSKNKKEESTQPKGKDGKVSNFQKYIKNIKHIKDKLSFTPSSTKKITKSSNFSKDNKKTNSESRSNISKDISDKKTNVVFSERDETVSTGAAKQEQNFNSQGNENERNEKFYKIFAQSNPHSNKNEIAQKNKCSINNFHSHKTGKTPDLFGSKNHNMIPLYYNEKTKKPDFSLNLMKKGEVSEDLCSIKNKVDKINGLFRDLDLLNGLFIDQITQCKRDFSSLT